MIDLIDRQALLEELNSCDFSCYEEYSKVFDMIDYAPTIEPKKGKWIDFNPSDPLDPRMKCSCCGGVELPKTTWTACPLCGADMRGADDEK